MIVPRKSQCFRRMGDDQVAAMPRGASSKSGRPVAPSTARTTARVAILMVLIVD